MLTVSVRGVSQGRYWIVRILGENMNVTSWVTFAWRGVGALNVESQFSWAVVQSYTAVTDTLLCQDTAEARGDSTGAVLGQG